MAAGRCSTPPQAGPRFRPSVNASPAETASSPPSSASILGVATRLRGFCRACPHPRRRQRRLDTASHLSTSRGKTTRESSACPAEGLSGRAPWLRCRRASSHGRRTSPRIQRGGIGRFSPDGVRFSRQVLEIAPRRHARLAARIRAPRRLVIGDKPGAVGLYESHGETRNRRYGLAVSHPGQRIKPDTGASGGGEVTITSRAPSYPSAPALPP
jgi:hypothetical protein